MHEVSMKQPEEMTLPELRAELRELGVSERLTALILREMGAADRRIQETLAHDPARKAKYDPLRAQLFVLKAHGMTNPDLTLNRKGRLFISFTTLQEMQQTAKSA
jgi:hypothetical protein